MLLFPFLFPIINPILIAAAVIPAFILMRKIYRADRFEPEPAGLLVSLLFHGVMAAFLAGIVNSIGTAILSTFFPEDSVISNHAFARRGAICIFVVRGAPSNFRWIDEHEWIRADNPDNARGRIYLMSEERFRTFVPGENAVH